MKATIEELMTFISVVENGSFSRAAQQLNVANSATSRAVKRLEQKLNTTLLNRTTRQLSLTHEGERYFRQVQRLLQAMHAAESELLENKYRPNGLLRVDAATPILLHLLIPLIQPFRERYPDITLSLCSSETFINLIDRKVDVAIRVGHLTDSSLRARPLFTSFRRLVASPDYLAKRGIPQQVSDLKEHSCLGFTEPLSLNHWPFAEADGQLVAINPEISSNSGESIKQLCLGGNGIACLSEFMVNEEIKRGQLTELLANKLLPIGTPVNAVYYSDKIVSSRIRAFIDFISQYTHATGMYQSEKERMAQDISFI